MRLLDRKQVIELLNHQMASREPTGDVLVEMGALEETVMREELNIHLRVLTE